MSFVVKNRVLRKMFMIGMPEAIRLHALGQNKGKPGEGILEWSIQDVQLKSGPLTKP